MRAQEFTTEDLNYMAGHCHVMALALKVLHPDWQIRAHIGWDEEAEDEEEYRVDHVYTVAPDGSAYDCRGRFDDERELVGPNETGGVETQFVDYSLSDIKNDVSRGELKPFTKQDIQKAIEFSKQSIKESQTAKAGIVQTDVYGTRAYHAKCMEPGCDWQSRRYDRIQQAQAAAKKHGEQHFKKKQGVAEGSPQPGKPVTDAIQKVLPIAQEIWFHGSRATGKHRRNSDTDILVVVPDDIVGDQYIAVVRILQKLSSIFDNYDIQPTKSGTNIHRIAQEEGRLLWSNKQGVAEGVENTDTAISLSRLGRFHKGQDTLAEFVPERATARYALHPDKWESTFFSLTNKDPRKLKYFGPKKIVIPPGTLVGDMAIANQFYRAETEEEKQKYAEEYRQSLKPYPVDIGQYRMPELLIPREGVEENFADGRKPGRKGLAKRVGVNCKQPVSKLRKIAKNSSGERQRMAHWCANMKSGRKK